MDNKYNDSTDPFDHIVNYQTAMHLQSATDKIMCYVFAIILWSWDHVMWVNIKLISQAIQASASKAIVNAEVDEFPANSKESS